MTVTDSGMDVLDVVAKMAAADPHAADELVRFALYEALCDEVDRIDSALQRDVVGAIAKAARSSVKPLVLSYIAKRDAGEDTTALEQQMGELASLVSKDSDDDPSTPYWDARGPGGRFRPADALRLLTTGGSNTRRTQAGEVLNARGYDRARTLGNALQIAGGSGGGPQLSSAGRALRLIGDVGPEAQTALEPGIRRTAYRYRGTERKPSKQTQREAKILAIAAEGRHTDLPPEPSEQFKGWMGENGRYSQALQHRQAGGRGPAGAAEPVSPQAGALLGLKGSSDEKRLQVLSNFGALTLASKLPDKERASISLAAGKLPPSVGMMFDAQGNLVSEAQGFNGDHYLPFDLKNLKRLKGGSYVRTRTSGGLTDEDIYTGLMTGARRVTVISNSGVYSLEFDHDLRGGRRYSDKARQMVDRYSRLVGAIGSGELYQNQLPPAEMRKLRETALRDAGGNAGKAQDLLKTRIPEAMAAASFKGRDEQELEHDAHERVKARGGALTGAAYARAMREEMGALRADDAENGVSRYRLDHEGYTAAQDALAQEFPFYVKSVQHDTLQDFLEMHRQVGPATPRRPRGGVDTGFTGRGGLAPRSAGSLGDTREQRRSSSGAANDRGSERTPQTTTSTADTGGAQEETPQATGLDALIVKARKEAAVPLTASFQDSLRIYTEGDDSEQLGALPESDDDLKRVMAMGDGSYAKWLFMQHSGVRGVAKYVAEDASPDELKLLDRALVKAKAVAGRSGGPQGYTPEAFDEARAQLAQLAVLKTPWSTGPDDEENPPKPGPEILSLDTPEKLHAFAASSPEVAAMAEAFSTESDADLGKVIHGNAKGIAALRSWGQALATDDAAPAPRGVKEDQKGLAQALANDPEHEHDKTAATQQQAWALWRMHRLVGATQGSGDAVPFAVAKRAGVLRHSADSPLAKRLNSPRPRTTRR